jgi:hypothetical protein
MSLTVTPDDWVQVQIFPDVMGLNGDGKDHLAVAERTLQKVPAKNLAYIARRLGVTTSDETNGLAIVDSLLNSSQRENLISLVCFSKVKGRLAAAEELFNNRLGDSDRRRIQGDFDAVQGKAVFAPFGKLVALVALDSSWLSTVFLHAQWRSRATHSAFVADGPITRDACQRLLESSTDIAEALVESSSFDCKLFMHSEVEPQVILFLFQRERKPQVKADYRNTKVITHGFGWVLFGIDLGRKRISLKSGGEDALGVIKGAIEDAAQVKLTPEGFDPFRDYDYAEVSSRVLGEYPRESEVQLIGLTLSRCNRRSVSPMSIGPPLYGGSIRDDLKFLKDHEAIALSSLADIKAIKVRYANRDISIRVDLDNVGLIYLRMDDSGFPPSRVGEFLDAFEDCFGLPLNCRIDPRGNVMGHAPIIAGLLNITSPDEVAAFQQSDFSSMVRENLLSIESVTDMRCDNRSCKVKGVESLESTTCPECHEALTPHTRRVVLHNADEIFKWLQRFFKSHTTRLLQRSMSRSSRGNVYSLEPTTTDDIVFEVLVATESNPHLIKRCAMIHRPVLVIHTHDFKNAPYSDPIGTVHVYLADLLAASQQEADTTAIAQQLSELLSEGQSRMVEISLRAGFNAASSIKAKGEGYGDQEYERDVFALLRSMFPFADRWGGSSRPDGFVSLSYVDGGDVREIKKVNWSYDAKLTSKVRGKGDEKGYDLNKSEKRKAHEYVTALQNDPALQVQGNRLNAHVFISNWITEQTVQGVVDHFRVSHNSDSLHTVTHIVVMMEDFLVQFHAAFHQHRIELLKRWPFVGRVFKDWLLRDSTKGYCILDGPQAALVVNEILALAPTETPVDAKKLGAQQGK